mmetsp:Transcript_24091/g.37177  ORF Transcript_24091/g.37177 Transcript_24091/m.37177 type:complete len:242 (-) Transcript_24091:91-816(-)
MMNEVVPANTVYYKRCVEYLNKTLLSRNESHGIDHALAVHSNCQLIWFDQDEQNEFQDQFHCASTPHVLKKLAKENELFTPWFFISISALLHDVCDHKYDTSNDAVNDLHAFVKDLCHDNIVAQKVVLDIIENVSFSKEKKGRLDTTLSADVMELRNVVSDADKLEAIGQVGLERCIAYKRELCPNDSEEDIMRDVAKHCDEKLLLLLPEYFRTKGGKVLGKEPHQFMVNWRENWDQSTLT